MQTYQPFPVLIARAFATALVALTATTLVLCSLVAMGGLTDHSGLILVLQSVALGGAGWVWCLVWKYTELWS